MAEYKPLRPIQPVSLPSFQYGLANVKAGRSKYQDLADALSQINPALQQFGRISRAKQQLILQQEEEDRLAREAEIAKGREAFQLDPSGVSEQLKNLTRKGINAGVIPENANAPFIIGGLQAQGEVLVNRDYRDQLRSLVETTDDPEVAIAKTKAEFLKRPEFSDPSVRAYAAEVFGKVDDEFRKDVNSRLDAVRTETNKRAWLELGRPVVDQVISGQLDVTDPNMIGWINHAAGVFEGSHKYAWDNLIKENLEEGLTEGYYKPTAVLGFLKNLRQLDLGGGVKFADAETGNAISDFYDDVEERRASLEYKAHQRNEIQYNSVLTDISMVLLDEYKRNGSVSKSTLLAQLEKSRELIPHHMRFKLDTEDGPKLLNNINKLKDESSVLVFSDITLQIEQGVNLDEVKDTTVNAFKTGQLTEEQFDKLNTRIERTRDFDEQVLKTDSYRNLRDSYNAIITGFNRDLTSTEQRRREGRNLGYFQLIDFEQQPTAKANDVSTVYQQIKTLKGEFRAQRFVDERYEVFRINLRNSLESMFFEQVGLGKSIQDARNYVIKNQADTADKLFKSWSTESINVANTKYLN
jgi:hypothetical protein